MIFFLLIRWVLVVVVPCPLHSQLAVEIGKTCIRRASRRSSHKLQEEGQETCLPSIGTSVVDRLPKVVKLPIKQGSQSKTQKRQKQKNTTFRNTELKKGSLHHSNRIVLSASQILYKHTGKDNCTH
jgi:hypothetical protein